LQRLKKELHFQQDTMYYFQLYFNTGPTLRWKN